MNPGDIFHDPSRRSYDPYDPNRPPPQSPPRHAGQPFPAAPYLPSTTPNLYDNLHPQQPPQQMHHSNSQPFGQAPYSDPLQAPGGQGYGDPFRDNGTSEQQWAQPPGSHHYPSYPLMPNSNSAVPLQHPSTSLSPSRPHIALEPARTRFDSNPAFIPHSGSFNNGVTMPDHRLSSPPPMLQHTSSDMLYPPNQGGPYGMQHSSSFGSNLAGGQDDGDLNDSAPLLNHAQPAFGPGSASGRGFQLRDDGDMGSRGGALGADEEDVNVHYGPVPTRVVRRNKTQKRVK